VTSLLVITLAASVYGLEAHISKIPIQLSPCFRKSNYSIHLGRQLAIGDQLSGLTPV